MFHILLSYLTSGSGKLVTLWFLVFKEVLQQLCFVPWNTFTYICCCLCRLGVRPLCNCRHPAPISTVRGISVTFHNIAKQSDNHPTNITASQRQSCFYSDFWLLVCFTRSSVSQQRAFGCRNQHTCHSGTYIERKLHELEICVHDNNFIVE
jgi:hypothetical protein